MKVGIGINIRLLVILETLECVIRIRKEVKNCKEMEVQHTEGKEDKNKLLKWEWKL